MKTIEEYIQFAMDNGYDGLPGGFDKYKVKENCDISIKEQSYRGKDGNGININGDFIMLKGDDDWYPSYSPLQNIITSKPFIEAIARGMEKEESANGSGIEYWFMGFRYTYNNLLNEITTQQAIAIRDGTLEEFITNLGIGKKDK